VSEDEITVPNGEPAWVSVARRQLDSRAGADLVGACLAEVGIEIPPASADPRAWLTWGRACLPRVGAVCVLQVVGGTFDRVVVGFLVREREDGWVLLGGEPGRRVAIAGYQRRDYECRAMRWPEGYS
jgi:hypothetical protein